MGRNIANRAVTKKKKNSVRKNLSPVDNWSGNFIERSWLTRNKQKKRGVGSRRGKGGNSGSK